jgi:hypothetical protein
VTWPRFTLLGMMVTVGLVAANFAAILWLLRLRNDPAVYVVMAILLPLNILSIGLASMGRQLVRSGECGPFSVGFQALGWPATLTLAVACTAALRGDGGWLGKYIEIAAIPLQSMLDASGGRAWFQAHPESGIAVEVLFLLIVLGGPLLIMPLIGGLVFRRFGITVIRRTWPRDTSPHLAQQRTHAAHPPPLGSSVKA